MTVTQEIHVEVNKTSTEEGEASSNWVNASKFFCSSSLLEKFDGTLGSLPVPSDTGDTRIESNKIKI